jgi:phosphate-selective porin OprO and OprP
MLRIVGPITLGALLLCSPCWAQVDPPVAAPQPAPGATQAQPATAATASPSAQAQPATAATASPSATSAANSAERKPKGLVFASADGQSELAFEPMLHAQGRFFLEPVTHRTDSFLVRRARPIVSARLWKWSELWLEPEFGGGTVSLLEAHGTFGVCDWLKLRVGKVRVPLGLEYLQSENDMTFAEPGLPSELVPFRDVGVELRGNVLNGFLSYTGGFYNGAPAGAQGDLDQNRSKDFAGRVMVAPLGLTDIEPLRQFGLGFAAEVGAELGSVPTFRSFSRLPFFQFVQADPVAGTPGVTALGRRVILTPQAHYYYGPVGVLAEYIESEQRLARGPERYTATARAWQVSGSIVLGGAPSYQGVKVDHPLDFDRGHWGALELAGRYDELRIGHGVFGAGFASATDSAEAAQAWAAGLHWYLARHIAWKLDLSRTHFVWHGPLRARPDEMVLLGQIQLAPPL